MNILEPTSEAEDTIVATDDEEAEVDTDDEVEQLEAKTRHGRQAKQELEALSPFRGPFNGPKGRFLIFDSLDGKHFRQVLPTNEAESHTQRSQYHEDYTEDDGATEDEVEMAEDEGDIGGDEEDLSFAEMNPPTDFFNSAFDAGIYDSV
ncbi:hypothetical protein UCREL1_6101 [Eutypa lata UCREL1]|uniref:Uncharacterized protein n=1 Tax=Eutypa lata (strain UCR-EL1) TaxID=1287681 RepID=M7SQX5_EUTLA|nr:hypothetical protein UCREL1_6101 [Eutypa lata UCREL1]